jgi:hypothetical protein
MNRLTFLGGLPKEFHPVPSDGWSACSHVFGKHDFTEGAAGRVYICQHCRAQVLFRRKTMESKYETA